MLAMCIRLHAMYLCLFLFSNSCRGQANQTVQSGGVDKLGRLRMIHTHAGMQAHSPKFTRVMVNCDQLPPVWYPSPPNNKHKEE